MFRRVLFPTDFSAYATAVMDCLPELKAAGTREVLLLGVIRPGEVPLGHSVDRDILERVRWGAEQQLHIARLALEVYSIPCIKVLLRHGIPFVKALKVAEIQQEMRRRELAARLEEWEALEQKGRYQDALDLVRKSAGEYPDETYWTSNLERLERKTHLADLYQRALGALQSGDRQTAQTLLAQVVVLEPGYEEATRYLHLAVTGVDVAELQDQLESKKKARHPSQRRLPAAGVVMGVVVGAAAGVVAFFTALFSLAAVVADTTDVVVAGVVSVVTALVTAGVAAALESRRHLS